MDWIFRLVQLVFLVTFIFYFIALGKNVSRTEKKHKRDMTYEINPFTGNRMPVNDNETDEKDKKNQ